MKKMMLLFAAVVLTMGPVWAHTTFTGRSGAPGLNTCASSCHGGTGGAVTAAGFPTTYTPGQTYTVTVSGPGTIIVNFNASCRVGTGSVNAGTIAAGTATSVYNVTGETNGVHFTSGNVTSGTFTWTAPVAGTGSVRLYLGALESNHDGPNTTLVLVATEAAPLPGVATAPNPADAATGVPLSATLSWTAGPNAISHDVAFGTTNPPPAVGNQALTVYAPFALLPGTVYYWRVDERNASGATPGAVWSFTTLSAPPPAPQAVTIASTDTDILLDWPAVSGAASYNIYRGTTVNVDATPTNLLGTAASGHYADVGILSGGVGSYYYVVTATNP